PRRARRAPRPRRRPDCAQRPGQRRPAPAAPTAHAAAFRPAHTRRQHPRRSIMTDQTTASSALPDLSLDAASRFVAAAGLVVVLAEPLYQGRTQQLWLITITNQQGKDLARGQLRLQNISRDSSPY